MQLNNMKQNYIRLFFTYLAVSLFVGVPFALLNGIWPKSITGWLIVFIFGLPTIILGEYIGEKLFSDKISQTIDKKNREKIISIRRMAYALIIGIVATAVTIVVGYLTRKHLGAHFSIH
jgi:uncharacterized membrane protein